MPHFMSNMAYYHREPQKRKASRKGSPTLGSPGKGTTTPLCVSPPGRVFYRQDLVDTQTYNIANIESARFLENLNGVQLQDELAGVSPPKVNSSQKTKSGAGIRHAPPPAYLPQPPKHWMGETDYEEVQDQVFDICIDTTEEVGSAISNQLKMLLKVQG